MRLEWKRTATTSTSIADNTMIDAHRRQLTEFLKSCRARISPGDLGLPDGGRRRTPGLRREDVAALAGVSVTWYTWLEQGRDIRVSAQVLEQISSTLKMSGEERDYLFSLVQHRPAPTVPGTGAQVSEALQRMIDALGVPAIAMTERWDVLAWNTLTARLFRDYNELAPADRNLFRILILNEEYRLEPAEFEAMARRIVPKFRVDFSQSADEEAFEALIGELTEASPKFRELWSCPELATKSEGINAVRHPELGGITFEHSSYVPEGSPRLRLVVFVPHDEESAVKLEAIRAELKAT
jgi:transcriptional regulator with XRE-family HTH domain